MIRSWPGSVPASISHEEDGRDKAGENAAGRDAGERGTNGVVDPQLTLIHRAPLLLNDEAAARWYECVREIHALRGEVTIAEKHLVTAEGERPVSRADLQSDRPFAETKHLVRREGRRRQLWFETLAVERELELTDDAADVSIQLVARRNAVVVAVDRGNNRFRKGSAWCQIQINGHPIGLQIDSRGLQILVQPMR
jgi:hypothetical protein